MNIHACRVCGFINDDEEPPWGEDGRCPTFNFCDCCGVEFGYQDCLYENIKRVRRQWLRDGAQWDDPKAKPANWNVVEQLDNVSPDEESLRLAVAIVRQQFPHG